MSPFFETVSTIALAIVGLGLVSVLVSRNAQTSQVIQSTGSAFSNALGVAEAPVTGANYTPNLSYPGTDHTGSFGFG
jgi:hypothetical protein